MAVDPVCKMNVNESEASYVSEHDGKKYYFCAQGCKNDFDGNPEKYIGKTGGHEHNGHHCCGNQG
jgi:YHS domain-containing protein